MIKQEELDLGVQQKNTEVESLTFQMTELEQLHTETKLQLETKAKEFDVLKSKAKEKVKELSTGSYFQIIKKE